MNDGPIQIQVTLEDIDPSERFAAALIELAEAANELLATEPEAAGYRKKPVGMLELPYFKVEVGKPDTGQSLYVYLPE